MALPNRLWLPDGGQELPTFAPFLPRVASESVVFPLGQRWRRRAVLAGTEGQPERTVLVEWFSVSDLHPAQIEPLRGFCHINLLRLHQFGQSDGQTAYAISEAPLGLDLATIAKTAQVKLPAWWAVAVLCDAARGLRMLHQFLAGRGVPRGHGAVDASSLFVSASGRVQVLTFAPLMKVSLTEDSIAPEVRHGARFATAASDVYSLAALLLALPLDRPLPDALLRLLRRCQTPHAEKRPTMSLLCETLAEARWLLGAPLNLAERLGSELSRLLPATRSRDLADGDWGSIGPVTFGPLPKTLYPLSPTAVSLSATWDAAPAVDLALPPPRAWSWRWTLAVALATVAGGALAWLVDRGVVSTPRPQPTVSQPVGKLAALAPQQSLPERLLVRAGEKGQLGGLRCQILRSASSVEGLRLTLLLVNGTTRSLLLDPMSLRVSAASDSQSFAPEPIAALVLPPGLMQTVELRFVMPQLPAGGLRLWLQP